MKHPNAFVPLFHSLTPEHQNYILGILRSLKYAQDNITERRMATLPLDESQSKESEKQE